MYALFECAGKQFKAKARDRIRVPRLEAQPGENVTFEKVLLVSDDNQVQVGKPYLENATVNARVVTQAREPKIIVYKYKRRKDYHLKRGHRQHYTKIEVESINV